MTDKKETADIKPQQTEQAVEVSDEEMEKVAGGARKRIAEIREEP